jgi:lysophospholipase L1-like esterase
MDRHSRRGTTKAFLRDGRAPGATTIVACVGDSITEGVGSADWVAMLRDRVRSHDVQVINAGVAGDLAWNVLRRLDAVIECDPDIVTLMVGTNDVAAGYFSSVSRLFWRLKGIRQTPTIDWYVENVSAILRQLRSETHARIAIIEIPMLGEDLTSEKNGRVNRYNDALHTMAEEHGVTYLPLHDRLVDLLEPDRVPPPYQGSVGLVLKVQLQHHVLHRSWDDVGARNGLVLLTDHTHLGERAAELVAELVAEFIVAT